MSRLLQGDHGHDDDAEKGGGGTEPDAEAVTASIESTAPHLWKPSSTTGGPARHDDARRHGGDDADAVSARIKYSGSIQQAGTVNRFGSCKWSVFNAKDIVVTPEKDSCRRRRG